MREIIAKLFVDCGDRDLDWDDLDDGEVCEILVPSDTVPLKIRTHPLGEFILDTSMPVGGDFLLQYHYRQMDAPVYFLVAGNRDQRFKLLNSHNTDLDVITEQARILNMSAQFTVEICK